MSGGHFDYDQYKIEQIAESIERIIAGNKKEVEDKDRWHEVWVDRIYYYDYPDKVIEKCFPNVLEFFLKSTKTSNIFPLITVKNFACEFLVCKCNPLKTFFLEFETQSNINFLLGNNFFLYTSLNDPLLS